MPTVSGYKLKFSQWGIKEATGYEPKTTFWMDFSIADRFGTTGVLATFNRAFKEWRNDYIYLTELVMVLNHKIGEHYGEGPQDPKHNGPLARLYNNLWMEADRWACDHLTGEELQYFYNITD